MAEILISLTIIGIIAAITLPSLRANINEKTWATQRKVLYSRMSQAISLLPSLNGYGVGETQSDTNEKAAQAFVTDGLSNVLKINNICDSNKLKDCGLAEKITVMGTNSKMKFPKDLSEFNPAFTNSFYNGNGTLINPQKDINTAVVAFVTTNGESVAVFYNPLCQADMGESEWHYSQPKMCVNFIYDLNGIKGPNKMGKDIGFITALYSTDSNVVAPMPLENNAQNGDSIYIEQKNAAFVCRVQDENSRVPNIDELTAMFYNKRLLGISSGQFWSGTLISSNTAWYHHFNGYRDVHEYSIPLRVRCVKK